MTDSFIFADSHIHTEFSHDSRCTVEQCAAAAAERGISAITIADHCDISFCRDEGNLDNVKLSVERALAVNQQVGDSLSVIAGVELGDGEWNPRLARIVTENRDLDVIIGSIHAVPYKNYGMAFSCVNFGGWREDDLIGFMDKYFDSMLEMLDTVEINVLAHLTVPLRYINGKYGHSLSPRLFYHKIETVLSRIIERGIALEVNTSTFAALGDTMPDEAILRLYRELGGRLITLGSDAHVPELIGSNFKRVLDMLRKCGFDHYSYMKAKKFISIEI